MRKPHFVLFVVIMLVIVVTPAVAQARSGIEQNWDAVVDQIDPVANTFRVAENYFGRAVYLCCIRMVGRADVQPFFRAFAPFKQ